MVTVKILYNVYRDNPPTICKQISLALENAFYNRGVKAKRKWLEIIEVSCGRFAVSCHNLGNNEVEVSHIRMLKDEKYSKSTKKETRLRK